MRFIRHIVFLLMLLFLITGCGTSQTGQITPAKTDAPREAFSSLRQASDKYLQGNRALTISAQEVYEKALLAADPGYILVDIRNDEHYAKHHIPGSIHISYADAWRSSKTDYLPKDKKIIVIDYSGHSSSQLAAYWSLLGLDSIPMKHGMAAWSKDKDVIGGSPLPCEPRNFAVTKDESASQTYDLPVLDVKAVPMDELLRHRGETIATKPVVIQADDLLTKLNAKSVFVLDIRAAEHFKAGHIVGSVNIPFRSLTEETSLKKLPANRQIVVVDYDGHAASQAARLLNLLGYDSLALRDGMSVWTVDAKVIGAPAVACTITERQTAQLNAPLNPGPSTAAT